MIRIYLAVVFLFIFNVFVFGQTQTMESIPGSIIVCPPGEFSGHHHTPVPAEIMQKILQKEGSEPCANITVVYSGFTPEAQNAFQAAVDIWSYSISSPVPIVVEASWDDLEENVLGAAGPTTYFRNFQNAPSADFYPVALANQIAGTDLAPQSSDILSYFNSNFDWYYGTDGNPPFNQFDLMTVVLHELGHGLGFISSCSFNETTNKGSFGLGANNIPLHFDRFLILGQNGSQLTGLSELALGNAMLSDNVFSNSSSATAILGGSNPKIYAPNNYSSSSLSHWDENAYPAGNIHSLMTPQLAYGEAIHNVGPITLRHFEDMGWPLCDGIVADEACLAWQYPSPSEGYTNFNTAFGGAPCDVGAGCPFNEIQDFQVNASEAYSVNGFIAGGEYTFSICNGPDAGSWVPDFTIRAPSGAVDAAGSGTGCSISWTASESGTYLIVINQEGSCGITNPLANGYPALTCEDGTAICGPNYCATGSLEVVGQTTLCPEETTTVRLEVPASIPSNGYYGISFYNVEAESGISLLDVSLPYTFDYDLNGVLSANGEPVFLGTYEVTGFVYTDPQNVNGSICAISPSSVLITFRDVDDVACTSQSNCQTESLVILGEEDVCPDGTATVDLILNATIPTGGGYAIEFYHPATDSSFVITHVILPFTFDNDINGVLSFNNLNVLEGEYELTGIVYSDETNIAGSICSFSEGVGTINFLSPSDSACMSEEPCFTETLVVIGDSEICPDGTATVDLILNATIPTGGGYAIEFYHPATDSSFVITHVILPFTFDNDINGVLSFNNLNVLEGEYELTGIVYSDETNISGSICSFSEGVDTINFLSSNDSACMSEVPCFTETLVVIGDSEICPDGTATLDLILNATIPTGGGYAIEFYHPATDSSFIITHVILPFTFDNDINGVLSFNNLNVLEGEYELTGIVYSDETNISGSICSFSEGVDTINFLSPSDSACMSEEPCFAETLVLTGDSEICPGETTTVDLINPATIPAGGGYAIEFSNGTPSDGILLFDVSLPFTFDNDLNGFLSGNGDDALVGEYELTGIVYADANDLEGSVCASSENVITVTFRSVSDQACATEEPCFTETLVITGDSEICPDETTTVDLINPATIPAGGGYAIEFSNGSPSGGILLFDVSLPFTFDNDLNGFLSGSGDDALVGEYELTGIVYADANDTEGNVCAMSEYTATINFLLSSSPVCVTDIEETESIGGFVIYPNPATDYVTLKLRDGDIRHTNFRIMDMHGRILFEETHVRLDGDNTFQIDVSHIAQGIYTVVQYSDYRTNIKRLVISK